MSVIIQGLKLPAYQGEHKEFDRYGCFLTVYKTGKVELHIFEKDFDVKDIPTPHGRLIDADKAAHSILMMSSHPCGCSIENVKDVVEWLKFINGDGNNFAFPTIIEAEVSE